MDVTMPQAHMSIETERILFIPYIIISNVSRMCHSSEVTLGRHGEQRQWPNIMMHKTAATTRTIISLTNSSMDHNSFSFNPNNGLPQESKLATYLNRGSTPNIIQPIRILPQSPEINPNNPEFIPGTYYGGIDDMSSSPGHSRRPASRSPTVAPMGAPPVILPIPTTQVRQENVGGTTYFYSTVSGDPPRPVHMAPNPEPQSMSASSLSMGPATSYVLPQLYSGNLPPSPNMGLTAGLASSYYQPDVLRSEMVMRNQILLEDHEPYPGMPHAVERYVDLIPLEEPCNSVSTYRGTHRHSGEIVLLRRLHDFRLSSTKCPALIDKWKAVRHPNIAKLREVFSTRAFRDMSLIFVFDYHPGAITMEQMYLSNGYISEQYQYPGNPHVPHPYSQNNPVLRGSPHCLFPEATIWSLVVQLTAALRAIHAQGLACRKLDPTKVIVNGYRVRISWCGVDEVAAAVSGAPAPSADEVDQAQQEDLTALGHMVLALVSMSPVAPLLSPAQLQLLSRSYSNDLKNLVSYLLTTGTRRNTTDLMPMIGGRFYTQIEALQKRSDTLEDQLTTELDNERLYRILIKLATINERPEFHMDGSWSETGDRYMLKLFRDYVFHPVAPNGTPWLDQSHLTYCLNQLDSGTGTKIQLMSRDEQSILVISFAELKHCLEQAFGEVTQAAEATMGLIGHNP